MHQIFSKALPLLFSLSFFLTSAPDNNNPLERQDIVGNLSVIKESPTLIETTVLRGGPGVFGAPRGEGKKHTGVDIVANQSNPDKTTYLVRAVSAGVIAYARMNGSGTKGYGYTVIIDHQNGFYSLYAHLTIDASSDIAKLGQKITQGQTIGYLADLSDDYKRSSGNVWAKDVLPDEKIQLHFELFKAPAGRSSQGAISPIKEGASIEDPTKRLKDFSYSSR